GIPRPLFSRPTFALAHAFALAQVEAAVRRGGSERLADPVGPEDFDRIDLIDRAQSEMSDRLAAASGALSRGQPHGPGAAPAADADLGPVGDALRGGIDRPHAQPVAAPGGDVAEDACRSPDGRHEQIHAPVAIEVTARQPAGHVVAAAERRVLDGDVAEA